MRRPSRISAAWGSGPRAPRSCAPSSPSAMAAAGGPKATRCCPFFGLLLLLLIAGPTRGWNDPGECCPHSLLLLSSAGAERTPSGDHIPSTLFAHFHPLRCSSLSCLDLLLFPDKCRLLGSGRGGAGRSNVINVPISLPWIPRICPPFPSSGYTPHPLSLAGNLVPHLRLLFCCQECLMSWLFSWLPVATPESCHGTGNL